MSDDTALWAALADHRRRAIVALLLERPRTVGELVEACGLSQPGTSKHLRVLREAGLVRVRQDAQRRVYALDPAPIAALDAWLAPYRALWNESLDALGRRLDESPADAAGGPSDRPEEPFPPGRRRPDGEATRTGAPVPGAPTPKPPSSKE
ncbi:transcriptional regulator [Streptomyces populi]|uniref:Transcriptional regulator n=1 Tax=Streptomyces populi TaxID=2058924 RepID=A0A2I0SXI1_9ACTN|nr:metalloregulator ArsR/SmtB family transcription factor [Streptomyces populi]PKT74644.1 transcriptional regulator [Streptomyces populi]